ncbi:MAG: Hydrogenase-4 component B [uncultured Thiotrichaceae bacterium]|uniref:Hydrogenase-4 component B n=1 Tax=uncultured Thiotrichaceae bacterium TaxID=298394 RepID=A0A6S6T2G0_9GAMM|nr:MAG: Hydrogenase-4 component B [uncultured Thiotrichaceae bacterium]
MNDVLLSLTPALPLVLGITSLFMRNACSLLLAPVFAFVVAVLVPVGASLELPWLLLGSYWQLDQTAKMFLLFSSLIWIIATLYMIREKPAHPSPQIYRCLFMLAMAGNFLLILAADMVSFYLGFAMMGLTAYGLILKPSQHARRAARVYLGFTVVGELALFAGMIILFNAVGSIQFADLVEQTFPGLAVALILLGFGIKLALPGLHPWLPLTYTAAPVITVAVLSGPMMKAGLLGWMRFLAPAAEDGMQIWGEVLLWLGALGVFWGFVLAMMQREAKAVLAYSSVSKMGFVSFLFGYALVYPAQKELILAALTLFAMHHLLLKPMLFLGLADYRQRGFNRLKLIGIIFLSLSMVAVPFSGGATVKIELAEATAKGLTAFFVMAGLASALMMMHFLYLVKHETVKPVRQVSQQTFDHTVIWWLLLPVAWWGPFMPYETGFDLKSLIILFVALTIYALLKRWFTTTVKPSPWTQPGDLYHLVQPLRFTWPVYLRSRIKRPPFFSRPFYLSASQQDDSGISLISKGLLWLILLALLIIAMLSAGVG